MITGVKIRQNSLRRLLRGGFSDKRTGAVASGVAAVPVCVFPWGYVYFRVSGGSEGPSGCPVVVGGDGSFVVGCGEE